MKRDLVADPERRETIKPGKCCVARGAMNNIAFPQEKARKVGAVLPGYPGDEGHFARWSSRRHITRRTGVRSRPGIVAPSLRDIRSSATGACTRQRERLRFAPPARKSAALVKRPPLGEIEGVQAPRQDQRRPRAMARRRPARHHALG